MKMADFSALGDIIEKFSKKGEKVASIVVPDDSGIAGQLDKFANNVVGSSQATESEKIAAIEFKKEISGSLAERVAAINRQKDEYILKMSEQMGESYAKGIRKVGEANVPLDAIAQQAEAASNAMQVPPDAGVVPPQASDALMEGGDQKTLDEVKDTAAAAVSAVASELAAVAESKGALEGQAPPPGAAEAPVDPAAMGGIMPSGMAGKVASVIVPSKEEKEKNKVDKLAEAMAEGLGDETPLSEDIEGGDTAEEAIAMAEQIVNGMRRDEEGKVKPPATAIGESVDDKLVAQIAQSIMAGNAGPAAGAEGAPGPEGDGGLGEAALGEGGEEGGEPGPEMGDEGDELGEAAIGDEGGEADPSEALLGGEGGPDEGPGEGGEPSDALVDEEQGGKGENSEDIDPATMAMLEEAQEGGSPEGPAGPMETPEGDPGEEGIDPNDPEVMAAAAEIAKNMAEEEERKRGVR